jgi:putative holliday junction resolvase
MKFLALDIGTRRIGAASCDRLEIAATPLPFVPADRRAPEVIAAMVENDEFDGIVIGLPLSMDGQERDACAQVRRFVATLQPLVRVPIELVDERLTTKIAEGHLIASGMRREKRRENRDSVAAALLLQTFLDRRRSGMPSSV